MNFKTPAITALVSFLVAMAGIKGYQSYTKHTDAAQSAYHERVIIQTELVAHTDTLYDTARTNYVQFRDRVLHDTVTPPTVREKEIIHKADSVVVACDSLKTSTHALVHTLENPPSQKRVVSYGEALYDALNQQPVLRLGVDVHIAGPVSVVASGEWDVPVITRQGGLRTLAGVRVSF